jgi:hypothetical protein
MDDPSKSINKRYKHTISDSIHHVEIALSSQQILSDLIYIDLDYLNHCFKIITKTLKDIDYDHSVIKGMLEQVFENYTISTGRGLEYFCFIKDVIKYFSDHIICLFH